MVNTVLSPNRVIIELEKVNPDLSNRKNGNKGPSKEKGPLIMLLRNPKLLFFEIFIFFFSSHDLSYLFIGDNPREILEISNLQDFV